MYYISRVSLKLNILCIGNYGITAYLLRSCRILCSNSKTARRNASRACLKNFMFCAESLVHISGKHAVRRGTLIIGGVPLPWIALIRPWKVVTHDQNRTVNRLYRFYKRSRLFAWVWLGRAGALLVHEERPGNWLGQPRPAFEWHKTPRRPSLPFLVELVRDPSCCVQHRKAAGFDQSHGGGTA